MKSLVEFPPPEPYLSLSTNLLIIGRPHPYTDHMDARSNRPFHPPPPIFRTPL